MANEIILNMSPVVGRYIRIQKNVGFNGCIALGEIEILGGPIRNLAYKKKAIDYKPSSEFTLYGNAFIYPASYAVDGNTDGDPNHNSVYHSVLYLANTTLGHESPYWQVDLGNNYDIKDIAVWNRTDGATNRLNDKNTAIFLINDLSLVHNDYDYNKELYANSIPSRELTLSSSQVIANDSDSNYNTPILNKVSFKGNDVSARYIRIYRKPGFNFPLNFAEVEVFGKKSPGQYPKLLTCQDDSRVEQANPDTNYGDYDLAGVNSYGTFTTSYFKFDLTEAPDDFSSVKLRLYTRSGYPRQGLESSYDIYNTSDSWNENSITWNNKPLAIAPLLSNATFGNDTNGDYVDFLVTDAVKTQIAGDGVASFVIEPNSNINNQFFQAKETSNSALRPKLIFDNTQSASRKGLSSKESIAQDEIQGKILIYPNPTTNILNIEATNNSISEVKILEINGRIISTKNGGQANKVSISTEKLTSGAYFVQVFTTDGKISIQKVIKQ